MILLAPTSPDCSIPSSNPVADSPARIFSPNAAAVYDAELVRRFNSGEEAAFVEIVTRYREKLYSLAFRYLRNRSDAEEIAQDTFVRAHTGLARFRGDSSLSSWLHRIAANLSCNRHWYFFRRHRQDTASLDHVVDDGHSRSLAERLASPEPGPVHDASMSEFSQFVDACLGELSAPQRKIITLRSELNQSYGRIAEALGTNVGTVKSRLARARRQLRQLLGTTYGEFATGAASFPSDGRLRTS